MTGLEDVCKRVCREKLVFPMVRVVATTARQFFRGWHIKRQLGDREVLKQD